LGLVLTAPVMAVIALFIRHEMGSPVIFSQDRPGWNGKPFRLRKFRTMHTPNESQGLLVDEDRLTRLGRWLRATSLDELPTLWNVLRGEMSLVGPRPLLIEYLNRYTPRQARRHEVRPGVTGLAQISGRNALDWDDKLGLDVDYVDRRCWALDLAILWRTVAVVWKREGIQRPGYATMPKFQGTK